MKYLVECGCGKGYTRDEFDQLEHIGDQKIPAGENGDGGWDEYELELRNCSCGSTIAVEHPVIKFIEPDENSAASKMFRYVEELQRRVYLNLSLDDVVLHGDD
jgi:hypothetical protein